MTLEVRSRLLKPAALEDFSRNMHSVLSDIHALGPVIQGEGSHFGKFRLPNYFMVDDSVPSYLVLGFDAAQEVLSSDDAFSTRIYGPATDALGPILTAMPQSQHGSIRDAVGPLLSGSDTIEAIKELVATKTRTILRDFHASGGGDLADGWATPLSSAVVAHLCGFPDADMHQIEAWESALMRFAFDPERGRSASAELHAYILNRKASLNPRRHVAALMSAAGTEASLGEAEIVAQVGLLLESALELLPRALANAALALLLHPEQLTAVAAQPFLLQRAVDEALRWEPPAAVGPRRAVADCVLGGVDVQAGAPVFVAIAAANRDSTRWNEPERFDIARPFKENLTFGVGRHGCIARALCAQITVAAIEALLQTSPTMSLVNREATCVEGIQLRGPIALHVAV